jgi:methylated-DNA-[protein]-cysteine S-methyltransferase
MALTFFPTDIGTCGLAWNEAGLTGFQLPGKNPAETEIKLALRSRNKTTGTARPHWVRRLIERVQHHLAGHPQDFSTVPLDWSLVSDFQQAVYQQMRGFKPGDKKSYGELARLIGLDARSARAIGVAMAKNPWPLIVPCHRVVSARGKMTGYSAPGGIRTKTRLLVLEGAELISE